MGMSRGFRDFPALADQRHGTVGLCSWAEGSHVDKQRVIFAYRNVAANRNISHIGLGVTAMNSAKSLRSAGIETEVWPIAHAEELSKRLEGVRSHSPATHVVVSAPWIPTLELARLAAGFPNTRFAVNCHSNLGFLQAD